MAFKKNSPGCNASPSGCGCSAPTCDICADTGGDGPCGMNEVAGTVVVDADFVDLQASDSIALSDQTSGSEVEVWASTKIIAADDGDECELLIKSNSDGTTCYFARLTVGASATLKLFSRTAGVDTQLATAAVTAPEFVELELRICYGNGGLSAREDVYGSLLSTSLTTNVTTRPYAGVGTGTITTDVVFYDFTYGYGYNASSRPTCRTCYGSCIIASDDFTRADSTSLGADWTEAVGNFAIVSNELSSSTAGSIVLHNALYNPDEGVRVRAKSQQPFPGGVVRYIIDWADADNYYCAEYDVLGDSISIIRRQAGSETVLATKAWVALAEVTAEQGIAYDPIGGRIYALDVTGNRVPPEYLSVSGIPQLTNRICGLMLVSASATFDTFRMEQIFTACVGPEECDFCTDDRNPLAIADQIEVTLAGIVEGTCGSCASLNATFVLDLLGAYGTLHGVGCMWRYQFPSSTCGVQNLWAYREASGEWGVIASVTADPGLSPGTVWIATGASDDCSSNSVACAYDSNPGGGINTCNVLASTATITVPA